MLENVDWGAIIFQIFLALISSGSLGLIISYTFTRRQKLKDQKFQQSLEEVKAALNSGTYITNMQYEREFNLLVDLWGNLINLEDEYYEYITLILDEGYPESFLFKNSDVEKYLDKTEKIKMLCDSFCREMSKYEPFFDRSIKKSLLIFPEIIFNIIECAEKYLNYTQYNKSIDDSFDKLSTKIDELRIDFRKEKKSVAEAIRDYLNSLKVK